jgi:hypothetical protein
MVNKGAIGSLLGLVAIAMLLAVGCGGGDETVAKADFVREGNAVCGKWQEARSKRFREVSARFKPPATQAKQEKVILFLVEPYEDSLHKLKDLEPPSGEAKQVEAMINLAEEALKQGQASPGTLLSGSGMFNKSNEAFESYGLEKCKV